MANAEAQVREFKTAMAEFDRIALWAENKRSGAMNGGEHYDAEFYSQKLDSAAQRVRRAVREMAK